MPNTKTTRRPRRMAREADASAPATAKTKPPKRLDQLQDLLTREGGASIAEMTEATGWQSHSVRGAMAGALKKRGLTITSVKDDGIRRYRAQAPA